MQASIWKEEGLAFGRLECGTPQGQRGECPSGTDGHGARHAGGKRNFSSVPRHKTASSYFPQGNAADGNRTLRPAELQRGPPHPPERPEECVAGRGSVWFWRGFSKKRRDRIKRVQARSPFGPWTDRREGLGTMATAGDAGGLAATNGSQRRRGGHYGTSPEPQYADGGGGRTVFQCQGPPERKGWRGKRSVE